MSTKSISPKSRFLSHSHQLCFLKRMDEIPQRTFEEIVEKYVEMNISHPFREGNDRDIRLWLDYILKNQIQKVVDWNKIDKEDCKCQSKYDKKIQNKNVHFIHLTSGKNLLIYKNFQLF